MISKCLVLVLAVVAEISAFKYNSQSITYVKHEPSATNIRYAYHPTDKTQRVVTASSAKSCQNQVEYARPPVNAAPVTRNLVAKGKYPVALPNSGPPSDKKIPVVTSHLRAPVQQKPTLRLQSKIPAARTISHTCTCFKTVMKPRVQQQLITVPTIHRYIETFHRPVVENIHYEAYPVNLKVEEQDKPQHFQVQPNGVSEIQINKNPGVQTFEVPVTRTFKLSEEQPERSQRIEIPRVHFGEEQKHHSTEFPRIQFPEEQKPSALDVQRVQFIQIRKPQTLQIEFSRAPFVEHQKPVAFNLA